MKISKEFESEGSFEGHRVCIHWYQREAGSFTYQNPGEMDQPPLNWYKLNLDGSTLSNPGLAGVGGLIRNDKGEWIKGYARAIGLTTSVEVELWALWDRIRLYEYISLQIPAVIIDLDAHLVVDPLEKNDGHPNGIGALVSDCKIQI